jgi:hypothetical protein
MLISCRLVWIGICDRFEDLDAADASEPLAYVLRDLDDPRAIPLLMGKDGRDLRYFFAG